MTADNGEREQRRFRCVRPLLKHFVMGIRIPAL
jgi:hypothetical protein